jgi:hypothetical protein
MWNGYPLQKVSLTQEVMWAGTLSQQFLMMESVSKAEV